MLLFSRMVRKSPGNNEVQRSPYESAEESTGQRVEIMHEYLHYFTMFLAFEVLGVIVILWSTFSRVGQASSGIYIASLLVFGLIFEIFMLMMAKNKGE